MKHSLLITILLLATTTLSHASEKMYLQLIDKLDRPQDGYCIDVVGNGAHLRFNMPLTAHNCKGPGVYDDEVLELRKDGTLYFPAYKGCVTVMGVNKVALPGVALMIKECGKDLPFLNAKRFQKFKFTDDKKIRLANSNLCIMAGDSSYTTYSLEHRWRSLFMENCDKADNKRSRWHFINPKN
jgi:hypothetical protein